MSPELASATNYYRWVVSEIRPFLGKRVLDVGGGYGTHLEQVLLTAPQVVSVDRSPEATEALRERFRGRSGFEAVCGDILCAETRAALHRWDFDTVTCLNVLEHIEDDAAALRAMRDLVAAREGRVILQLPAHPWLYGELDRQAGHHRRYSTELVRRRFAEAGLEVVRLRHMNRAGVLPWLANGRLWKSRVESRGVGLQVRLFDRYLVGLARALDALTPLPFGQSLIAVGRARHPEGAAC